MQNEDLPPVGEEAALEAGVPASSSTPSPSSSDGGGVRKRCSAAQATRLSVISQRYDVDGDGVLDAAEQAMRDMDKSNRGYLTNDRVYDIVKKQMEMQKQVFDMKRVVVGLSVFTVVLALSNLATAWAAAILARDTTVDQGSADMMTKDGERMVGTKAKIPTYDAEAHQDKERLLRRELGLWDVGADNVFTVTPEIAQSIFVDCTDGSPDVRLKITCGGSARYVYDLPCDGAVNRGNKYHFGPNKEYTISCSGGQSPVCAVGGTSIDGSTCDTEPAFLGLPLGDACLEDGECESNYCDGGVPPETEGICKLQVGKQCYEDGECASGSCQGGVAPNVAVGLCCPAALDTNIVGTSCESDPSSVPSLSCEYDFTLCCPDGAGWSGPDPISTIECRDGVFGAMAVLSVPSWCTTITSGSTCESLRSTCADENSQCETYETFLNCPEDGCTCGNGVCEESDNYCPLDCTCDWDGVCGVNENSGTCFSECP